MAKKLKPFKSAKLVGRARVRCKQPRARPSGVVRACDARRTLAMPIGWYKILPPCRKCGARNYRRDEHRNKVGRGGKHNEVCRCPNYFSAKGAFPHRKGAGLCEHNPNLTEQDFEAMQQSMLSRRRNGY